MIIIEQTEYYVMLDLYQCEIQTKLILSIAQEMKQDVKVFLLADLINKAGNESVKLISRWLNPLLKKRIGTK